MDQWMFAPLLVAVGVGGCPVSVILVAIDFRIWCDWVGSVECKVKRHLAVVCSRS